MANGFATSIGLSETVLPDIAWLEEQCADLPTGAMLQKLLREVFPGRVAVVSSFGAEAAALLDLVARADRTTPVIFLDTGKHFPETLRYRTMLTKRLRLSDVRVITPDMKEVAAADPGGTLWQKEQDACCDLRKVRPLKRALRGFQVWISGRKRHHGGHRSELPLFERDGPHIKINPLADWGADRITEYYANYGLPRHPLFERGYLSIGCATCTEKPKAGESARAGRWRGRGKTECGIHKVTWDVGL